MDYTIVRSGESRSFPDNDPFYSKAQDDAAVVIYLGAPHQADDSRSAILLELGTECLGVHTGEQSGLEGSNVLGFSRYRNGDAAPSNLIELVRQPFSSDAAIAAAIEVFSNAGFEIAVCADRAGRIIDRLVRPKYNDALRFLDEGLASARDMDLTCCMGLGYRDGPIERLEAGGLHHHFDITSELFAIYGKPGFAPGRRATVAKTRAEKK